MEPALQHKVTESVSWSLSLLRLLCRGLMPESESLCCPQPGGSSNCQRLTLFLVGQPQGGPLELPCHPGYSSPHPTTKKAQEPKTPPEKRSLTPAKIRRMLQVAWNLPQEIVSCQFLWGRTFTFCLVLSNENIFLLCGSLALSY